MASVEDMPVEQLRAYIRELKPEARSLLLAEFERAALRGDDMPAAPLVLQELRNEIRGVNTKLARIGNPQRLFFEPLEHFLVDEAPDREFCGRIPRGCLEPVWHWISRGLMPAETKAYAAEVSRVLLAGNRMGAESAVRIFQDRAVEHIDAALAAVDNDDKARRRLAGQFGVADGLKHLRQVANVLRARDTLSFLASRLPPTIRNLADETLNGVKNLLDSVVRDPEVFVYALVTVMDRLVVPWQVVRLAVKAAESDLAERIAQTSYGVAVPIVLAEIERKVGELRTDLRRRQVTGVGILLKDIHDGVRVLRSEIDLSGGTEWGRRLPALRGEISRLITAEVETLPGRVRRLLRPRAAQDISSATMLDQIDVAETESLLGFLEVCRQHAGELAVNEVTLRVHSDIENYLDNRTPLLLEALRHATKADRKFHQSQVDAAVRFVGKIFGAKYASLLAKAGEVAARGAKSKAAKG